MQNPPLFPRQTDSCIKCPAPLPCSCASNQDCFQINRDCFTCAQIKCVARKATSSASSKGTSNGALAGGIVGAIVFLAIAAALFFRYRRKSLLRRNSSTPEVKKDVPAAAETVLNRPDPTEKSPSELNTVRNYPPSTTTINLNPDIQTSFSHGQVSDFSTTHMPHLNPFDDTNSIQTVGSEGTNVIPIALIPPESHHDSMSRSEALSSTSSGPIRPARSPGLNLDHVNVSNDTLRTPHGYSQSTRSGISSRNSYMSGASYSSDFLNEAPMIMTPTKGTIRQVVGVVKAEVITTGSLSNANSDALKPPAYNKPVAKSPLASTSFGPSDLIKEDEFQETVDPFADENVSNHASYSPSTSLSATTSGHLSTQPDSDSTTPNWLPVDPSLPWSKADDQSRPSSTYTQAGSVVDIASATRVNVGLKTPGSTPSYRTTMGRLISPTAHPGTLQEQQQRALAHAQAQAQAQGLDRRSISGSSVISATSTRADSILESFPFVPPSPISDRPIRSPPVSPLGQQSFSNGTSHHQHTFVVAPPSPLSPRSFGGNYGSEIGGSCDSLPAPLDRRTLGLSTGSQLSTASSGLGSFPFQIGADPSSDHPPPTPFNGRQRASLDTLALTSDLSSYPLNFDRDSVPPPHKK